ncbi:MAG: 4Fe-4S binding protein [Candidatus Bathyarchaeia archaeon]
MHYGYVDGSGEYYIIVDSDKCDGCSKCVQKCPQAALEMITEMIDLEDKTLAAVTEKHRKNLRYACSQCKPETNKTPCVLACLRGAIKCVWKPL